MNKRREGGMTRGQELIGVVAVVFVKRKQKQCERMEEVEYAYVENNYKGPGMFFPFYLCWYDERSRDYQSCYCCCCKHF